MWIDSRAAIIGTNVAALPVTTDRIMALPESQRAPWLEYLSLSRKRSASDRSTFQAELRMHGITNATSPVSASSTRGIILNRPADWYSSEEALRLARNIVSFQTPAGGWSKNLNMVTRARSNGELFAHGNASRFSAMNDLDQARDPGWTYVGTFDNGATITQLRFLAKVISASDRQNHDQLKAAFYRGLDYIFEAQYPNGGWPQVWPLQGGYQDCVTLNDGAMVGVLDLLLDVAKAGSEFSFVQKDHRDKASDSVERGLRCLLALQVVVRGQPTAWSQQYDALTLQPASARNYEMPSISSGESAGAMRFLMRHPAPSTNIAVAIRSAARWFETSAIRDKSYRRTETNDGRHLVDAPGNGPLWSRYYDIQTNRPIFGDRDKSIHDTVEEISRERRDGYAWFTDAPEGALKQFGDWEKRNRTEQIQPR